MQAYQADIAKFEAANTKVFGISMDAAPSLKAFAEQIKVTSVPFLSDWNRTVTKQYGLFNEANGYGRRATFVIDKEGVIRYAEVLENAGEIPNFEAVRKTLEALN